MSRLVREFSYLSFLSLISLACTNDPAMAPSSPPPLMQAGSVAPPPVSTSTPTPTAPALSTPSAPAANSGMTPSVPSSGVNALSSSAAGGGGAAGSAIQPAAGSGGPSQPLAGSSAPSSPSPDAGAPPSSDDDPFFPDPNAGNTTPPPAGMCENLFCFDVFDCAIFHLEEAAVCNFTDCVDFVCKQ